MSTPLVRYPEDYTGISPNNKVVDELKPLLSDKVIRAAAPTYGPFFAESIVIYDNATNRLLTRGVDFYCAELLQEASIKVGKEIYNLIMVDTSLVSSTVRITYQALGGYWEFNAEAIINLYETFVNDNRFVDWLNVLNKPLDYVPTLHNHYISEVYGFETIINAIERLRNAIILSDVPAFEAVIDYVRARVLDPATFADIDLGLPANKAITLETLMYSLNKFNFNTISMSPSTTFLIPNTQTSYVITTTNINDNTSLYWTIEHIDTNSDDFFTTSGITTVYDNKCNLNIIPRVTNVTENNEKFRIQLRRNSVSGPVIFTSNIMSILGTYIISTNDIIQCFLDECVNSTNLPITPETFYLIRESK